MDALTSPPPLFASGQSQTTNASGQQTLSSDFETFLKMLTVQVQNQDPLNPVDSTDYATQLATFSSVEQQVLTNDLLRDLGAKMGGGALQEAAGWIGMEALARAPVYFYDTPIALRPDFAEGADSAALVVRDASGAVVQRFTVDPSEDSLVWAGTDDTGALLPEGTYRFEIESYADSALIETRVAAAYTRIIEARSDDGDVLIRLSDGSEVPASLIEGLRAPW